jgi:putative oxidoreductase
MITVIQIFVYPTAWPDHIQWIGFMIFIFCRGPGALSLDALIGRLSSNRAISTAVA